MVSRSEPTPRTCTILFRAGLPANEQWAPGERLYKARMAGRMVIIGPQAEPIVLVPIGGRVGRLLRAEDAKNFSDGKRWDGRPDRLSPEDAAETITNRFLAPATKPSTKAPGAKPNPGLAESPKAAAATAVAVSTVSGAAEQSAASSAAKPAEAPEAVAASTTAAKPGPKQAVSFKAGAALSATAKSSVPPAAADRLPTSPSEVLKTEAVLHAAAKPAVGPFEQSEPTAARAAASRLVATPSESSTAATPPTATAGNNGGSLPAGAALPLDFDC